MARIVVILVIFFGILGIIKENVNLLLVFVVFMTLRLMSNLYIPYFHNGITSCAALLSITMLSVVFTICLIHHKRQKRKEASLSTSSDSTSTTSSSSSPPSLHSVVSSSSKASSTPEFVKYQGVFLQKQRLQLPEVVINRVWWRNFSSQSQRFKFLQVSKLNSIKNQAQGVFAKSIPFQQSLAQDKTLGNLLLVFLAVKLPANELNWKRKTRNTWWCLLSMIALLSKLDYICIQEHFSSCSWMFWNYKPLLSGQEVFFCSLRRLSLSIDLPTGTTERQLSTVCRQIQDNQQLLEISFRSTVWIECANWMSAQRTLKIVFMEVCKTQHHSYQVMIEQDTTPTENSRRLLTSDTYCY